MAAQPANNAMLPAPLVTALYRDFYNDPASDVFNRNNTDVLAPYNPTTGGTPAEVRTLACHCWSQGVPSAYLLLHLTDMNLHVYMQLDLFNLRMGLPATPWDDQMFIGSKGELYNNHQTLVRWDPDYFRQGNATRVVPTPMELCTKTIVRNRICATSKFAMSIHWTSPSQWTTHLSWTVHR